MKYKAVIFDLDGTLLDTIEDIAISCNYVLDNYGFEPHPVEAYNYLVGEGAMKLLQKAADIPSNDPLLPQMLQGFKQHYEKQYNVNTALYEGIMTLLTDLEAQGLKLAVFSNKPDDFVKSCVKHYMREVPFEKVRGEREGIPKKPDPAGLLDIMEALHVNREEVLYVGDTKTDMLTARGAKVDACGVSWGFRKVSELEEYGAMYIVHAPSEILALCKE